MQKKPKNLKDYIYEAERKTKKERVRERGDQKRKDLWSEEEGNIAIACIAFVEKVIITNAKNK